MRLLNVMLTGFLCLTSIETKAEAKVEDIEKVLRIGIGQEFDSLNPLATSMLSAMYIYDMIDRNLVSLDHEMKWHPQLAEEIPSFKNKLAEIKTINGVKKLVSIWNLRANTKWGDGVDITCEDAKFTWNLSKSNSVTVINREAYSDIETINCDPKKPKRLEFIHSAIKWDFYKLYFFYILPKHVEGPVFTKFGSEKEGYDHNSNYVKNPTLPGLFNGPYMISEIKLGSHVIVKRNPFFFGKKPYFDKITIRLVSDTTALEANLIAKQVDMVSTIGFNMDQALSLEKRVAKENLPFEIRYVPGFSYEHIDLNLDNPILKSKNVRKALLFSIDRENMTQALFEGKQVATPHFLSPRDPWYSKLPSKLKVTNVYSKKEAEKLLDADGWKLNPDGFRYKEGKKLSLVFSTTAGNRLRETVQTFIVDQWKKIGIEAITKNLIARTFFSDLLNHRKLEGMAMFTWTFLPELSLSKFYSSKNIPSEANGWTGRNYSGFKDDKMDVLLEKLEVEMNESKRQTMVNQVVEIYSNAHFTVPLYNRVDISAVPKNLKGYFGTGTQQMETLSVEDWTY